MSAIPANSVPGQFESTPNENEQHKLETGNGRSERMRRRFAVVSLFVVKIKFKSFYYLKSDHLIYACNDPLLKSQTVICFPRGLLNKVLYREALP